LFKLVVFISEITPDWPSLLKVSLGTFGIAGASFLYRQDAFPVTKPTEYKHIMLLFTINEAQLPLWHGLQLLMLYSMQHNTLSINHILIF